MGNSTLFGRHCCKGRELLLNIITCAYRAKYFCYSRLRHGHDNLEDLLALFAFELVNRHLLSPFLNLLSSGRTQVLFIPRFTLLI